MNIPNALFRQVLEACNDVVVITKADSIEPPGPEIVYVNEAFEKLTGYSAEEVIGKSPRILQGAETSKEAKNSIRNALLLHQPVRTSICNYSKTGEPYWLDISIIPLKDNNNKVTHFAAIERDVTEQKAIEAHLEKLSKTDSLTGLLNHGAFHAEAEMEDQRSRRNTAATNEFSIIELDIDHFKNINDSYGHDVGDEVLQDIGKIIMAEVRTIDKAGRLGGEEFSVILPRTDTDGAFVIAERLRTTIEQHKFKYGDRQIKVTVSIGVASQNSVNQSYTRILKLADQALYQAKKSGRNQTHVASK